MMYQSLTSPGGMKGRSCLKRKQAVLLASLYRGVIYEASLMYLTCITRAPRSPLIEITQITRGSRGITFRSRGNPRHVCGVGVGGWGVVNHEDGAGEREVDPPVGSQRLCQARREDIRCLSGRNHSRMFVTHLDCGERERTRRDVSLRRSHVTS